MQLKDWLDDYFFQTGCFFCQKENEIVYLSKGGHWSEVRPKHQVFFFLRPFYENKILYLHDAQILKIRKDFLIEFTKNFREFNIDFEALEDSDDLFSRDFHHFKEFTKQGLKKAVLLSRRVFKSTNSTELKKRCFSNSIKNNSGWGYGLWDQDSMIVGVTPELLLKTEGNKFQTFALAGTAQKGEEKKLLASPKDLYEHGLVVENILEDIAPYCKSLSSGETSIVPYGRICHLKTDIKGQLTSDDDLWSVISKLTPTAALGGHPRKLALEFLKQSHYYKRFKKRIHGSTFGISDETKTEAIVMIRNVQAEKDIVFFEAGAGIVIQSNETLELEEIKKKIEAIKEIVL
jgi:isochorismate synthase EntC